MQNELYDPKAEEYILGCCLVEYTALENTRSVLTPNDFMTVDNRLTFEALLKIADEYGKSDTILVADELKKSGDLNRAGGTERLYDLQAVIVDTLEIDSTLKVVKDYARRREYVTLGSNLMHKAKDYTVDLESIANELFEQSQELSTDKNKNIQIRKTADLAEMDFEPIQWIIPDLIPTGLTVLAGASKIGKSFLCWNLAFAVAMQGRALSIDIETQRNVLYLALDDSERQLKSRHRYILDGDSHPQNVFYISDEYQIKLNDRGIHQLEKMIDETEAELVIVDTLAQVKPETKNSHGKTAYDIDYNALIPIRQFANRKNIGIILVTHTRKGVDLDNPFNEIQGSTGIQAGCDTLLMLKRDSDKGITLSATGRTVMNKEWVVELKEGGIWDIVGETDDLTDSEAYNDVIKVLLDAEGEPLTAVEIAERLESKKDTISKRLRRMLDENKVIKVGHGKYIHPKYEGGEVSLINF